MSIIVTNVEQQKQIINQVHKVLYNIESELKHRLLPTLQVSVNDYNDTTLQYKTFKIYNNFKIYARKQPCIEVTYSNNETFVLLLDNSLNNWYVILQDSVRGIKKQLDNYTINSAIQSMQQDVDNMLVESFNNYMQKLNISYSVKNINQIDWKNLCEKTELPAELLQQFAKIADWEIISQYGNFNINDVYDCGISDYINIQILLLYNTNFSVKVKQEIIEDWNDDKKINLRWLTNKLTNDRLEQGVAVDNTLKYFLENEIELDYNVLSAQYPLTADIITQYLPKLSIDKLLQNKNVECDMLVLFKQKLTQTQSK